MSKLLIRFVLASALFIPAGLHATPIYGTFGFNFTDVSVKLATTGGHPTPLAPYTGLQSIDYSGVVFSGSSSTEFPIILAGTSGISGSNAIYPNGFDGGNGSPFTLTFGNYGTFTETSNPSLVSQTTDPQTLALLLIGDFTPGSYFAGMSGGPSTIVIDFTESTVNGKASYSGSGTFAIDGATTAPEPSSLVLLGTGLFGAIGAGRRLRRN